MFYYQQYLNVEAYEVKQDLFVGSDETSFVVS